MTKLQGEKRKEEDYNWTDEQFEKEKKILRKEVPFFDEGMRTYKRLIFSISNSIYACKMGRLKKKNLNPIMQTKEANLLWKEHLKRIK